MSDNNQRRKAAMQSLDKEIKSRDRAEKMKPLGVVTAAAVAIVVIVGGIIFATKYTGNEHKQDQAASQSTTAATPEVRPLTMKRAKALGDTVTCKYDKNGEAAKEVSLPKTEQVSAKGTAKVKLTTNEGEVDMELDRAASRARSMRSRTWQNRAITTIRCAIVSPPPVLRCCNAATRPVPAPAAPGSNSPTNTRWMRHQVPLPSNR